MLLLINANRRTRHGLDTSIDKSLNNTDLNRKNLLGFVLSPADRSVKRNVSKIFGTTQLLFDKLIGRKRNAGGGAIARSWSTRVGWELYDTLVILRF